MKTNVPKNATGDHKKIIIIVLAVIVLIAIVAAVIFNNTGKKKKENNENTNNTETVSQTGETGETSDQTESVSEAAAQIEALIKSYRTAFANADIEALKTLYNTDQVMNSDVITATSKIITGYENTACYIKDGMDDTSKVVFIYDDFKIADIDALIPNVSYVYLKQKADGTYFIYPGEYDQSTANYVYSSDIQKYISELIKEDDIKALYTSVNEKFSKLVSEDPKVKAFVDKLTGSDTGSTDETGESGETGSGETKSGKSGGSESGQTDSNETGSTDTTAPSSENLTPAA